MAATKILLLALFHLAFCEEKQEVLVETKNGPVIGEKIVEQDSSLDRFLGIPYAKPPVGKLRFRRPVPAEPWKQPIQATKWPNLCVQSKTPGMEVLNLNQNFTEDCLYLNIWSPDVKAEPNKLRPVLFWIHGGALIFGGSSFLLYDGRTLAKMADAVVVTINYR